MSFRTRRVLFSTPLFMIFEFLVLRYMCLLFGGVNDIILIFCTLILGAIQAFPMFFEEKNSTRIGRFFSEFFGVWEWMLLMLFFYLVIISIINCFIIIPKTILIFLLILLVIFGIYNYYKAHKLVIKEHTLYMDKLSEDVNIVHLSDVHFGSVRHKKIIKEVADNLKELSKICDIAIITGDLADGSCIVKEDDFIELKDVDMPIIFVAGNHDYYPGLNNVYKACKKADIIILENENYEYKGLNIFGIPFSFGDIEAVSEETLTNSIISDGTNIVIYHAPYYWDEYSKLGFNIQLSGHTHGGQFYPIVWFADRLYEYNRGIFKKEFISGKTSYLSVTTGVGSMDTPMRSGTNSEMLILKLRKYENK